MSIPRVSAEQEYNKISPYINPLGQLLKTLDIYLTLLDSKTNDVDYPETVRRTNDFFKNEGIEKNKQSVDKYVAWLSENKQNLEACKKLEKELKIPQLGHIGGIKHPKKALEQLRAFLAKVFGIEASKVDIQKHTEQLIALRKKVLTGLEYISQMVGDIKIAPDEIADLNKKALELYNKYGIRLTVLDPNEGDVDNKATAVNVKNFLLALGVKNETEYKNLIQKQVKTDIDKKIADLKKKALEIFEKFGIRLTILDPKEGDVDDIATAIKVSSFLLALVISTEYAVFIKILENDNLNLLIKASNNLEAPKYLQLIFQKAKQAEDFKALARKIIDLNLQLIAVEAEENNKKILQYYWLCPDGKVEKVSEQEQGILSDSAVKYALEGGIFKRLKEVDRTQNYLQTKKARMERLLVLIALINNVSPETILALKSMLAEGKDISEVIKKIVEIFKRVGILSKSTKSAGKKTVELLQDFKKKEAEIIEKIKQIKKDKSTFNADEYNRQLNEYYEKRDAMRAQHKKYKRLFDSAKSTQSSARAEFKRICRRLKIDEKDLKKAELLLAFLEKLQTIYASSPEVNLESVASQLQSANPLTGTSLKGVGNPAAVFTPDFFKEATQKPQDAIARSGFKVLRRREPSELLKHPILLIKAALNGAGVAGIVLDAETITSAELIKIAHTFSPRFSLEVLGFADKTKNLKTLGLIQKGIEKAKTTEEKEVLKKLFESLRGSDKVFYTKAELELLKKILAAINSREDGVPVEWQEIQDNIFTEKEYTFRVKPTRGGLSEYDQKILIKFAKENPTYVFTTLLKANDSAEAIKVKQILLTIAKQLGEVLKKEQVETWGDVFRPGKLWKFAFSEMLGKNVQEADLPSGIEDHLWLVYRWERMGGNKGEREAFTTALTNFRKAKKDLENLGTVLKSQLPETMRSNIKLLEKFFKDPKKDNLVIKGKIEDLEKLAESEIKDKEVRKAFIELLKKTKKDVEEKLEPMQKAQKEALSNLIESLSKNRLGGNIIQEDIKNILNTARMDLVMPHLDALMVEQNGLRLNSILGRGFFRNMTVDQLKEFILKQIGNGKWVSLTSDPGEDIKTTIAKRIVSLLLTQMYFNKIRQGNLVLALLALPPYAGATKFVATLGLGLASFGMDRKETGDNAPGGLLHWISTNHARYTESIPFIKQLYGAAQMNQPGNNTNLAPYIHLMLVQFGVKDQFYIYDMLAKGLGKATRDEVKALVTRLLGEIARLKESNPLVIAAIEKRLPPHLSRYWEAFKKGGKVWEEMFEKFFANNDPQEINSASATGREILYLIQFASHLLQKESDILAPAIQTTSGGHIGHAQIQKSLDNGIAFRPSASRQIPGVLRWGGTSAPGRPFELTGVGLGAVNTAATFSLMPYTFVQLGIKYTNDLIQAVAEWKNFGDTRNLKKVAKAYLGLMAGIMGWQYAPIVYFNDAMQLSDEGHNDMAIGSILVMAKFFIDILRMHIYQLNEVRNFAMDRPTKMRTPLTVFNWPIYLTGKLVSAPAKSAIGWFWTPEQRQAGLLKLDSSFENTGTWWPRSKEWAGNLAPIRSTGNWLARKGWGLTPTPDNRFGQWALGFGKTLFVDWGLLGVFGQRFAHQYYGWGSRNRFLGFNLSERRDLMAQIKVLEDNISGIGKRIKGSLRRWSLASYAKKYNVSPDKIIEYKGVKLTVELASNGKLIYQNGDIVFMSNMEQRIKNLPKSLTVSLDGGVTTHELQVREVKIVEGNGVNIQVVQRLGGGDCLRLIVGADRLADKQNPINAETFKDVILRLKKVTGDIYDKTQSAVAKTTYTPEQIKRIQENNDRIAANLDGTEKTEGLWEKYKRGEISFQELDGLMKKGSAFDVEMRKKMEGKEHQEQINIMDNAKVKIAVRGGVREMSYVEARTLWVRALIYEHDKKHNPGKEPRTLVTSQIKAILAMHYGLSAQVETSGGKTIIRCALDILDFVTGRKMMAVTHNDLTAKDNLDKMKPIYESAGMKSAFVRQTDAGLQKTFANSDVIYLSMNDLAFIELNNRMTIDKRVDIPWERALFRVDEFDYIYVDEGSNPYIIAGGAKAKAEVKAWRNSNKTAKYLKEGTHYTRTEHGYEITQNAQKEAKFYDEKGNPVKWMELSQAQQKRILRSLEAWHKKEGTDYTVDRIKKDIVLIENGAAKYGSHFSDGLQQALQAKHENRFWGTRIVPESSTIAQELCRTLVGKIRHIVASSGTLNEISGVLQKAGIQYIKIESTVPNYEWQPNESVAENIRLIRKTIDDRAKEVKIGDKSIQIRGNYAQQPDISSAILQLSNEGYKNITTLFEYPREVYGSQEEKIKAILTQAKADYETGRPIVISVDDPSLAKEVYDRLIKEGIVKSKRIGFLSYGSESRYQEVFNKPIEQNYDILVTTLARRGTDIFTKKPLGFVLYLIDQEVGIWGKIQKRGRVARLGTNGFIREFASPESSIFASEVLQDMVPRERFTNEQFEKVKGLFENQKEGEKTLKFKEGITVQQIDALQDISQEIKDELKTKLEYSIKLNTILKKIGPEIFTAYMQYCIKNGSKFTFNRLIEFLLTPQEGITIRTPTDPLLKEIMDLAQVAYDEVLIKRFEKGAKAEKLLPQTLRDRLENIRIDLWLHLNKSNSPDIAKRIIVEQLRYIWGAIAAENDGVVDMDKIGYEDGRKLKERLQESVNKIAKMFKVKINLEIKLPTSGKFSYNDFAWNLAQQIHKQVFCIDSERIVSRNLLDIFTQAYIKFEQEVNEAREELVKKHETESKILFTSEGEDGKEVKARELFTEEFGKRVEILFEKFRRRVAWAVRKQRIIEALPIFGRFGFFGKWRLQRVQTDPEKVFAPHVGNAVFEAAREKGVEVLGNTNGAFNNVSSENVKDILNSQKLKGVKYIGVEGNVAIPNDPKFLEGLSLNETGGRKLIVFYSENGEIKACVKVVPEGAVVESAGNGYAFVDAKTGHPTETFILRNGELHAQGGLVNADQLIQSYGGEAARRIQAQRYELINREAFLQDQKDLETYKEKAKKSLTPEMEGKYKEILTRLGYSDKAIAEETAKLRWSRIEYRFGKKVVEILKAAKLAIMGVKNLESFLSMLFKFGNGDQEAADKMPVLKIVGKALVRALKNSYKSYLESMRNRINEAKKIAASAEPPRMGNAQYERMIARLNAIAGHKKLLAELGISREQIISLKQQLTDKLGRNPYQDGDLGIELRGNMRLIRDKKTGVIKLEVKAARWAQVEELAKRFSTEKKVPITPEMMAKAYLLSQDKSFFGEKMNNFTPERLQKFLESPDGKLFIAKNADTLRNRLKMGSPSLALEVLALLGVEQLAKIIGIDAMRDPVAHFAFVLGVTHVFGSFSRPIMQRILSGTALQIASQPAVQGGNILIKFSNNTFANIVRQNLGLGGGVWNGAKGLLKFPFHMVYGMGPGMAWAAMIDNLLVNYGIVSENNRHRHWIGFSAFFIPSVMGMLSPTIVRGAGSLVGAIGSRVLLGLGRFNVFAGIPFAVGFVLDMGTIILTSIFEKHASYERHVQARALDGKMISMVGGETRPWYNLPAAFFITYFKPLVQVTISRFVSDNKNIEIIKKADHRMSQEMQGAARQYIAAKLLADYLNIGLVDFSFLSKKVSLRIDGKIMPYKDTKYAQHPVTGKYMALKIDGERYVPGIKDQIAENYMRNYEKKYSKGEWTPEKIAAEMKKDGIDATVEQVVEVLKIIQNMNVQQSIGLMHFTGLPINDPIRKLFNKHGLLIPGKEAELLRWVFGKNVTEADIIKIRQTQIQIKNMVAEIDKSVKAGKGIPINIKRDAVFLSALGLWARTAKNSRPAILARFEQIIAQTRKVKNGQELAILIQEANALLQKTMEDIRMSVHFTGKLPNIEKDNLYFAALSRWVALSKNSPRKQYAIRKRIEELTVTHKNAKTTAERIKISNEILALGYKPRLLIRKA
ncbi:MAG: hypothetical protein FD145_610 [Candidatus Saganbacteria bacterium]|uniref:SecA family profile domain-containing protein n=1 Tax=Candidatus Saganbacteria bacterium TaxID=2575572 RepID=A0A833L1M3_UNCSA|nr:MAG: hypothetical protein FD145_610 [Candidatus Saganbacteria bacterium]